MTGLLHVLTTVYLRFCVAIALETLAGIFIVSLFRDLDNDPLMAIRKLLALIASALFCGLLLVLYILFDCLKIPTPDFVRRLFGGDDS